MDNISPSPNLPIPEFYKENYVVPWSEITPLDEMSISLLSICTVFLFIILFILLYAYIEIMESKEMEEAKRVSVIYIHTVLSFLCLLICILSMKPTTQEQKNKGLATAVMLVMFLTSTIASLMTETLSAAVFVRSSKNRSGLFYAGIIWGLAIVISMTYLGSHFAAKETILSPSISWFRPDIPTGVQLIPVSAILLVQLVSWLIANFCKAKKLPRLSNNNTLALRCMNLNTILMVPTTYGSLVVYGMLLDDHRLFYEYIFVGLLSIQCLLMIMRYIIFNPLIKNSLVDAARKEYDFMKVDIPLDAKRFVYVA